MVKLFKGLFNSKKETKNDLPSYQEFTMVDRHEEGKEKAQKMGGSKAGLITCISRIYQNHKLILRKDKNEQEQAKKPYRVKLKEYLSTNESLQKKIDRMRNEAIPKENEKIDKLQEDNTDIRKHPEKHTTDKASKVGFIIGAVIISFLTVYLLIFYSSASYSAFFKLFTLNDIGVADSIFDAQALTKAYRDGITELILIITIPFVFIGLGYLIHKFQEKKGFAKYLKIGLLLVITFVFDSILAYEITEKIYDIKAGDSFDTPAPYTIAEAFQAINFWLIIFAGFVVYLVWGFVFDFVMEAYAKLDKLNVLIRANKAEIKESKAVIQKCEEDIIRLDKKKEANKVEADKLQTILDHSDVIKPKDLEHSIMQFLDGWMEWLHFKKTPEAEREDARMVVEGLVEKHIGALHLENKNE